MIKRLWHPDTFGMGAGPVAGKKGLVENRPPAENWPTLRRQELHQCHDTPKTGILRIRTETTLPCSRSRKAPPREQRTNQNHVELNPGTKERKKYLLSIFLDACGVTSLGCTTRKNKSGSPQQTLEISMQFPTIVALNNAVNSGRVPVV